MHELIDETRDPQGNPVSDRMQERAGIIGTIMFLEQLTRHGALSADERKAARHQANFLKALVHKRSRDGRDTLDGAVREALAALMAPGQKALPGKPLAITLDAEP